MDDGSSCLLVHEAAVESATQPLLPLPPPSLSGLIIIIIRRLCHFVPHSLTLPVHRVEGTGADHSPVCLSTDDVFAVVVVRARSNCRPTGVPTTEYYWHESRYPLNAHVSRSEWRQIFAKRFHLGILTIFQYCFMLHPMTGTELCKTGAIIKDILWKARIYKKRIRTVRF